MNPSASLPNLPKKHVKSGLWLTRAMTKMMSMQSLGLWSIAGCGMLNFRGPRYGGFVFGVPMDLVGELERHDSGSGSSSSALKRALERLIAAGERRLDVDCGFFEHINDHEDTATWHDFVYRKLNLARDTWKMFEKIDVLGTLSPAYGSMGVNPSMLDL